MPKSQNATLNNAVFFLPGTSSIENKYETIEKSLSPYKITPKAEKGPPPAVPSKRHVNVSIRKQLELQHPNAAAVSTAAAAAASSTPTSPLCSTVGQVGFDGIVN